MRRILLTFALSLVVACPATAQQLKLAFNEGRVSLEATNVPVRHHPCRVGASSAARR